MKKNWFNIVNNEVGDVGEISIFAEIGDFGITVEEFASEFNTIKDRKEIDVYINSAGGSVFDGIAIYNLLNSVRNKVVINIVGLAGSIASIIALGGDERIMYEGSMLMIHNPLMITAGGADELRKDANVLDQIKSQIVGIYKNNSTLDEIEIEKMMNDETWISASEALKYGFITSIDTKKKAVASLYNLASKGFKKVPRNFLRPQIKIDELTIRDYEETLRDVGFSANDAKLLASCGFPKPEKVPEAHKDLQEDKILDELKTIFKINI